MKPDSFLSEKFLSEFVEKRPTDFFADNFLSWVSLYRFLNSHTDIVLDGEKESYANLVKTDELCKEMIRRYFEGDDSIRFNNWGKDRHNSDKPFSYYFLNSLENDLHKLLVEKGLPTLRNGDDICLQRMTGYEAIPVHNGPIGKLKNWSDLSNRLLPFHSMVIIDNYLLQKPSPIINLLKEFFPKNISRSVKVDVVLISSTTEGVRKTWENESENDYNNRITHSLRKMKKNFNSLERECSQYYRNNQPFNCHLAVLENTGQFHDRLLFTNSQFLTSGNSFGHYFDHNGKVKMNSPTILTLYSYACTHNNTPWAEIAVEMLTKIKELTVLLLSDNCVGSPLANPIFRNL